MRFHKSKVLNMRLVRSVLVLALAFIVCLSLTLPAAAYDEVEDITITVGYWGDTGYEKYTVTLGELASACGTHEEIYTWINQGNSPGTTEAEGIYLTDILQYCGIDRDSVYYYNFYTRDGGTYAQSNQQWSTSQLLGKRYTCASCFQYILDDYNSDPEDYLKNPESYYSIDDVFDFSKNRYSDNAWNERETVPAMLAIRTKSSSWKGYTPASGLDFSGMDTNGKPILMFGQAAKNEITRNLMAQMVTHIHIWFEGSPSITIESSDMEGSQGDEKHFTVNVDTPDSFLTDQIIENLEISVSDESVATLTGDGTVRITGEGTTDITATYNGKVYGKLTVTGKKAEEGSGSGSGSSEGDGSGSSTGKNNGKGAGSGSSKNSNKGSGNKQKSNSKSSKVTPKKNNDTKRTVKPKSSGTAQNSTQGSAGGASSGSGDNGLKVYKISEADTTHEVVVNEKISPWVWVFFLLALVAGAAIEIHYYISQVNWEEKARAMYNRL